MEIAYEEDWNEAARLSHWITLNVLGWSTRTAKGNQSAFNYYGYAFTPSWSSNNYGYISRIRNFKPSINIANAYKVIEFVNSKAGTHFEITQHKDHTIVRLLNKDSQLAWSNHTNPAFAICHAIKLAWEANLIKIEHRAKPFELQLS